MACLYIGVGDGGAVENGYQFLAHDKGKIWGTILRIDPGGRNSANGQYGIPQTNPFHKIKKRLGKFMPMVSGNPIGLPGARTMRCLHVMWVMRILNRSI
jgi:hypothetical protein